MGKETPLVARADAERVRKRVAELGQRALALLGAELTALKKRRMALPESWARKYKLVADQLRRDLRLDVSDEEEQAAAAAPPDPPADPLQGLRIVKKEAG